MIGSKVTLPRFKDADIQRALDAIAVLLNQLSQVPILNGRLLENVQLAVTAFPVKVAHGLGRTPIGYLMAGCDTLGVNVVDTERDEKYITLDAPATVTVDLWIF